MEHKMIVTRTERLNKVCKIIEQYQYRKNNLVPILQSVQLQYEYLPEDIMEFIAASLQIPAAKVYSVASFYTHFALKPKGKYVIKVCNGTACHVKESLPILDKIRTYLKLDEKKNTTDDMMFTVETVSCLGACGLAPVVVINEEVHSLMTLEKVETLFIDLQAEERKENAA
jgi:NADH-quinone oxidoreductase subunit E